MIAQSQSGTGKTAAFVLSMLSRVDTTKPYPQVRLKKWVYIIGKIVLSKNQNYIAFPLTGTMSVANIRVSIANWRSS